MFVTSDRVSAFGRLSLLAALLGVGLAIAPLRPLLLEALGEAWLDVGVFVAATFAIVFALESWFGVDAATLLDRHPRVEVPLAAALGAMPGCGGAVMVVTHFAAGRVSFGSLVAVGHENRQ